MSNVKKVLGALGMLGLASLAMALPALAQDAAQATAPAAAAAGPVVDKGDVAWMMTSSLLVLFMIIPGLALFYGGLVRSKNVLSIMMQSTMITCVIMLVWVLYGYSFAFGGGTGPFFGGFSKVFLMGVTKDTTASTFSSGFVLPEYVFICFQMTFAAITPALIIGAFAERIKFSAVITFCVLWATIVYFPIAHMVWDANGYLFKMGAIDFAGGTVVHINAGIAGLVGCLLIGPRKGYGKEMMAPHSLPLTMTGAAILWVGWFGFNAGSNLEANGGAALAMINTFIATAAATVAWSVIETLHRGKASMLGAASGVVAGLVAITPACGTIGVMGAIVLGFAASLVCYIFVAFVKIKLGYDDALDVFGVHGIGGIIGALGTGILTAPSLGGTGAADFSISHQFGVQLTAVVMTLVWSGVVSAILYKIIDVVIGLRPSTENESQGLDLTSHGEVAYHN